MKFRFEESTGKGRTGTLAARDLEDARAILERQGLFEPVFEQIPEPSGRNYPLFFGLICLLGLLTTAAFSSWRSTRNPMLASQTLLKLHVEGQIVSDQPLTDEVVEIRFPELPTRLRGKWKDVGDSSGRFVIHDEIVAPGPSPSFFRVTLVSGTGELLIKGRRFSYDAERSEEQSFELRVERPRSRRPRL